MEFDEDADETALRIPLEVVELEKLRSKKAEEEVRKCLPLGSRISPLVPVDEAHECVLLPTPLATVLRLE